MKKFKLFSTILVSSLILFTSKAVASEECTTTTGSYGQTTTTCKVLGDTTVVKHEVVKAAIDPNLIWMVLGGMLVSAGLLKGLSLLTKEVYWLD